LSVKAKKSEKDDALRDRVDRGARVYRADLLHEGIGHGMTAWLSGAHRVTLSTVALQSDIATGWISANGTLVNLGAAAILWLVLEKARPRSPAACAFLVLTMAANLFTGTGYFLNSGVTDFGDWAEVIGGLEPHLGLEGGTDRGGRGIVLCGDACGRARSESIRECAGQAARIVLNSVLFASRACGGRRHFQPRGCALCDCFRASVDTWRERRIPGVALDDARMERLGRTRSDPTRSGMDRGGRDGGAGVHRGAGARDLLVAIKDRRLRAFRAGDAAAGDSQNSCRVENARVGRMTA
jgi:hypothetical protein